jgi:simple sugar transport system ATP-binding protein
MMVLSYNRFHSYGFLDKNRIRSEAEQRMRRFSITGKPQQKIEELSGGNIQKVIIAREISEQPQLLIISEPSLGLDTRSLEEVHGKLEALTSNGTGIIVISSDVDEVLRLADRIVVLFRGSVAEVLANRDIDRHTIGEYMLGMRRKEVS